MNGVRISGDEGCPDDWATGDSGLVGTMTGGSLSITDLTFFGVDFGSAEVSQGDGRLTVTFEVAGKSGVSNYQGRFVVSRR